jgi:hypothetical protein
VWRSVDKSRITLGALSVKVIFCNTKDRICICSIGAIQFDFIGNIRLLMKSSCYSPEGSTFTSMSVTSYCTGVAVPNCVK